MSWFESVSLKTVGAEAPKPLSPEQAAMAQVGAFSPLWMLFVGASTAGIAFWSMTRWMQLATPERLAEPVKLRLVQPAAEPKAEPAPVAELKAPEPATKAPEPKIEAPAPKAPETTAPEAKAAEPVVAAKPAPAPEPKHAKAAPVKPVAKAPAAKPAAAPTPVATAPKVEAPKPTPAKKPAAPRATARKKS